MQACALNGKGQQKGRARSVRRRLEAPVSPHGVEPLALLLLFVPREPATGRQRGAAARLKASARVCWQVPHPSSAHGTTTQRP